MNLLSDIPPIVETAKTSVDKNLKGSDSEKTISNNSNNSDKSASPKTQFRFNLKDEVEKDPEIHTKEYVQPHSICLKISILFISSLYFLFPHFTFILI